MNRMIESACLVLLVVCASTHDHAATGGPAVPRDVFGTTPEGREVDVFTLVNAHGMQAKIINYGATLISLRVPDRQGDFDDVVLGFDTLGEYLNRNFGGTTGRYANRIGGARFTLDGVDYKVTANAGQHHIHGGRRNFSNVVWDASAFAETGRRGVRLSIFSADGEEGFPGNCCCIVTYTLGDDNALRIDYHATSDKPTVVNLTNHSYFNLAGAGSGPVYDHVMHIFASRYTVVDGALIPTGEIAAVAGTPLDFTSPTPIGARIGELTQTRGYDHNYVFDESSEACPLRVRVVEPASGRVMEVYTTEPGTQLYTANHVRDLKGRDGRTYGQHGAFCVETQHFPDSPNHPNFPSTVLRPGKPFTSTTVFRFSVRE